MQQSIRANGTATSPAANQALATIPAGSLNVGTWYRATFRAYLSGTTAATDEDNLRLRINNALDPSNSMLLPQGAVQSLLSINFQCTNPTNGIILLVGTVTPTVGAIYHAHITLTEIDPIENNESSAP